MKWPSEKRSLRDRVRHLEADLDGESRRRDYLDRDLRTKEQRLMERLNDQEDMLIDLADKLGYRIERETRKYIIVEKSDE